MNKKILCTVIGFLCIASTATAGRFSTTEYECSQMDKERDGMKCTVRYDEYGGTLLMFIHRKRSDPEAQRARTKYVIGTTIHNFLASGGIYITQRVIAPDGRLVERICNKIKRGRGEHCREWYPVEES